MNHLPPPQGTKAGKGTGTHTPSLRGQPHFLPAMRCCLTWGGQGEKQEYSKDGAENPHA